MTCSVQVLDLINITNICFPNVSFYMTASRTVQTNYTKLCADEQAVEVFKCVLKNYKSNKQTKKKRKEKKYF